MAGSGALDPDRYELGRLLGRGGLGEVYLARDRILKRDVAVKFVSADRIADADARRALLQEARAAAAIDHPNVCAVYEAGETGDGRGFIVMQYVPGATLASLLERGPLPVHEALVLCSEIADALAAAHRCGVIHRDLKPGNIMVTPSGRPKLLDFGIAKLMESSSAAADVTTSTEPAHVAFAGTLGYMSPEQIERRPIDARSDLFALGLVLYECLTGQRAFRGSTPLATIGTILHSQPPDPSSLRPVLTDAHNALCRQLLAKEPADRFQSGEELVAAIRAIQTGTTRPQTDTSRQRHLFSGSRGLRIAAVVLGVLALTGATAGTWRWMHPVLPAVPENADSWYRKGIEAIRQGAYQTGRKELMQAVTLFPGHVLAYSRLAEVAAELDDVQAAKEHLVQVSSLVDNESRLPERERLRLTAVRALVLRDLSTAIQAYRRLTSLDGRDAGGYLDLGRAEEAAGLRNDARVSYETALRLDAQYAAAYLRLGRVEGLEAHRKQALAAFAEAERLYAASSDTEGLAEVHLQRGIARYALNDLAGARADLERALQLATNTQLEYPQLRARLALSNVTASSGRYSDAKTLAVEAVADAEREGLEATAAGGLIDLAATLLLAGQKPGAEESVRRALEIAEKRGAPYTVARAKVELAEIQARSDRPIDAIATVADVLPFLQANSFRRQELTARSIQARAYQNVGDLERARTMSQEVLAMSDALHEEDQAATALATLAGVNTMLGRYPEAQQYRIRAEETHRRQGDQSALPYDLANHAELLIRMGHSADADRLLDELEAGIAVGTESYVGRKRRGTFLRAFDAATQLRCETAIPLLREIQERNTNDSARQLAPAIYAFCEGRLRGPKAMRRTAPAPIDDDVVIGREAAYWYAAAALEGNEWGVAFAEAGRGLRLLGDTANDELRWRLAAVGAMAAHQLHDTRTAASMSRTSRQAYDRLREAYGPDFDSYQHRLDLAALRKKELAS
jgi:tetratricopeptide (TPR) repeat protein/tRNA A-37 threonylcarbamoyl transferase component Bud32